ncbi:MAG: T9SS type A sorting domain-containing protein [candidate division Zixibacteria bacterium]|nr:T9SS type A sorting domain-containing protein [Candidatus Tariuqbacter arcticus]
MRRFFTIFLIGGLLLAGTVWGQDSLNVSKLASMYNFFGQTTKTVPQGNYAYITDYFSSTFYTMDISDPATPFITGECYTYGYGKDVELRDNLAFIAAGTAGLQVVDISDPINPILAGGCDTGVSIRRIVLYGDYIYAASSDSGLRVYDISNPVEPFEVSSFFVEYGELKNVEINNDYLYLLGDQYGLTVMDLTVPAYPILCGSYNNLSWLSHSMAFYEDYVYIASYSLGLKVIDVSVPNNPTLAYTWNLGSDAFSVSIFDTLAYVGLDDGRLKVLDINEGLYIELGSINLVTHTSNICVVNEIAYTSLYSSGLAILDVSDPAAISYISTYDDNNQIKCVDTAGNLACWGDYIGELRTVDISDPVNPVELGAFSFPNSVLDVVVAGNYAHVACGYDGYWIIDISDPTNPYNAGYIDLPGSTRTMVVTDGHAFISTSQGLYSVNIENINQPILEDSVSVPQSEGIQMRARYLYTISYAGLHVVDITDPSNMVNIGNCYSYHDKEGLALCENYAFITGQYFEVIDISNPEDPQLAYTYEFNCWGYDLKIVGNYLINATGYDGICIYEITHPDNIDTVGYYVTPGKALNLAISENLILLAAKYNLGIYDWSGITEVEGKEASPSSCLNIMPIYPNPFNSTSTITYYIAKAGNVQLAVYDVLGREVQSLVNGHSSLGEHEVVWDAGGCGSGVYFVKMTVDGGQSTVRKMVLVK